MRKYYLGLYVKKDSKLHQASTNEGVFDQGCLSGMGQSDLMPGTIIPNGKRRLYATGTQM